MQALLATRVPVFSGGTHKRCAQAPFQEIADTLMKAEGTDEDGTTVLVLLNNLSQLLIQEINGSLGEIRNWPPYTQGKDGLKKEADQTTPDWWADGVEMGIDRLVWSLGSPFKVYHGHTGQLKLRWMPAGVSQGSLH
ncbi:hypothetical protein VULLAG_LOCUS8029 [Vulpes lagopus]